tara:strand:+ start:36 stop:557 length:522 start_codon:yes stop_codon:yes gene_type:complete
VVVQLSALMMQLGSPLDASWLATCVFPLVEMHMAIENRWNPRLFTHHRQTGMALVSLLCFLEPSVLRSHPETFEWVRTTLKCVHRDGVVTNETAWSAGLKAWNGVQSLFEQNSELRSMTRDAKLEAILHSGIAGVRGCFRSFACLSAMGTSPINQVWLTRVGWGCDVFPAVYH